MAETPGCTAVVDLSAHEPRVVVRGEIDLATCHHLDRAVEQAFACGPSIVVDLSQVTFMDVTGVSVIIRGVRGHGDDAIELVDPRPALRRLLGLVGLGDLVHTAVAPAPEGIA